MSAPADPLVDWWRHVVLIERFNGADDGYGGGYDTSVATLGFVSDGTKLVVSSGGDQVVSSAQVALPAGTAFVPVDSRVTLPERFGSRMARVIGSAVADGGGLPTPDHIELWLE